MRGFSVRFDRNHNDALVACGKLQLGRLAEYDGFVICI